MALVAKIESLSIAEKLYLAAGLVEAGRATSTAIRILQKALIELELQEARRGQASH